MPVRGPDGFCIECADDEVGEVIGKISDEPGKTFDGYTQGGRHAEESSARRVREGRQLVSHRRSDAARRARLFLFRRSHRRHLPLEGRERRDQRSGRSARRRAGREGGQRLWRDRSRHGRARRHGGAGHRARLRHRKAGRGAGGQLADLCAAGVRAPAAGDGDHRHVQAAQGRAGEAMASIPATIRDPLYWLESRERAVRAADARRLCGDRVRRGRSSRTTAHLRRRRSRSPKSSADRGSGGRRCPSALCARACRRSSARRRPA